MSLTFHWFLPTYGDSRNIVGGGHGAPQSAARRKPETTQVVNVPFAAGTPRQSS